MSCEYTDGTIKASSTPFREDCRSSILLTPTSILECFCVPRVCWLRFIWIVGAMNVLPETESLRWHLASHGGNSTDSDEVEVGLQIFGVMFAIEFVTFITTVSLCCFGIWAPLRNSFSRKEEVMKALGLKNLHEYQNFLYNISTKPYVGSGYLYPDGTCGLPPGGWEDFWRVVANKHSFFSIFICDFHNLFKPVSLSTMSVPSPPNFLIWIDRLPLHPTHYNPSVYPTQIEVSVNYLFVSCLSFVLFSLSLGLENETAEVQIAWNLCFVNVVSCFLSEVSYFLLACPCCHNYGARTAVREVVTIFERVISIVFVVAALCFLYLGSFFAADYLGNFDDASKRIFWQFIVQSMLIQWFQEFLSFIPMFIDPNQSTCVSKFVKFLGVITCHFVSAGVWYADKNRHEEGGGVSKSDTENPVHGGHGGHKHMER